LAADGFIIGQALRPRRAIEWGGRQPGLS